MKVRTAVADLGWCVGKIIVSHGKCESLTIVSPADTSADRYAPAESVCIYSREGVVNLKDFLVAALNAEEVQ